MAKLVLAVLVVNFCAGCSANYYYQYQDRNPGWTADFPKMGLSLEETVASVFAPSEEGANVQVQKLRILDVTYHPWTEIPLDDLEEGRFRSDSTRDYLVLAHLHCAQMGYFTSVNDAVTWYLLPRNGLSAYNHIYFYWGCSGDLLREGEPPKDAEFRDELERTHPTA